MTHIGSGLPGTKAEDALGKELEIKLERLRKMMAANNVSAVHIAKLGNLAWLLCGGDALVSFADAPVAEAVVTQNRVAVLMQEVERDRLEREAFPLGVDALYYPWYDPAAKAVLLEELLGVGKTIADTPAVSGAEVRDFWPLRVPLTAGEIARYRALGRDASQAFTETLKTVAPGLKVEDTVLLQGDALEVLTADPGWPSVEVGGRARPDVLEL